MSKFVSISKHKEDKKAMTKDTFIFDFRIVKFVFCNFSIHKEQLTSTNIC